jgi:formylglycine-generating enzyme required for sulfatase activity
LSPFATRLGPLAAAAALFNALAAGCTPPVPPDMVRVPAGSFVMGTNEVDTDGEALEYGLPEPFYADERPELHGHLDEFFIDRYEVTHAQYKTFIDASGHVAPEDWIGGRFAPERADYPIAFVAWYDANDYCKWAGKRLPTEAEWEKAARGPNGLRYPWGNDFKAENANVSTSASLFGTAKAVGRYEAGKSPYGAYDMIGNVWEWTDSWYEPYPNHPNPTSNERFGRGMRVTRGLSFMSVGHFGGDAYHRVLSILARASFRSYDVPTSRLADVGFRCAKSAK